MNSLKDIMAYILKHYPYKNELSNARLTKMVYLSDWHQCLHNKEQITNINWYFDNYGPFVRDISITANDNPDLFKCISTSNSLGGSKSLYCLKSNNYRTALSTQAKESIDHVISKTNNLNWSDFINLVYSTYPIISSERYSFLNLVTKANEYKDLTKVSSSLTIT
jgi:hypothetical protein